MLVGWLSPGQVAFLVRWRSEAMREEYCRIRFRGMLTLPDINMRLLYIHSSCEAFPAAQSCFAPFCMLRVPTVRLQSQRFDIHQSKQENIMGLVVIRLPRKPCPALQFLAGPRHNCRRQKLRQKLKEQARLSSTKSGMQMRRPIIALCLQGHS